MSSIDDPKGDDWRLGITSVTNEPLTDEDKAILERMKMSNTDDEDSTAASSLAFSNEIQQRICHDVAAGVDPSRSRLSYTPEMLAWSEEIQEWWKKAKRENPDAEMHVPGDLPEMD